MVSTVIIPLSPSQTAVLRAGANGLHNLTINAQADDGRTISTYIGRDALAILVRLLVAAEAAHNANRILTAEIVYYGATPEELGAEAGVQSGLPF